MVAPLFAFAVLVWVWRGLDPWSVATGFAGATGVLFWLFFWDEPPQHVAKWKRGEEGERRTAKALKPLERKGWKVEHDVQRDGRANLDHVLTGPPGVFLLETKNLSGSISFEDGVLVARQFDDPDEVYRYMTLAPRLRGQAKELSERLRAKIGRAPWVTAVVVIWGHFPAGLVEHENVTYISGERLLAWLASR